MVKSFPINVLSIINQKLNNIIWRADLKKMKAQFAIDSSWKIDKPYVLSIDNTAKLIIEPNVHFRSFCNILMYSKAKLEIGRNVFFNNYCSINCLDQISIGENSLFGEGVKIYDHNHEYTILQTRVTIERNKFKTGPVKIGKNCWIGSNVTILKGVEIGDNVIIGAGNLIYKSIASNTIVKLKTEALQKSL